MRAIWIAVALIACTPELPPKPPYASSDRDAPDTPLGAACARLRHLGCPEGYPNRRGRTCFETLASSGELVAIPDVCIRASATIADVRSCGDASTMRVRCVLPAVDNAGSALP